MYNFRNLVFEGGGVKGLAYVGALKVLEEKGIYKDIERVAGASAGAICALLVALNYSTKDIQEILWNLDFNNFMDGDWGVLQELKRLKDEYGWYKGDFFETWIKKIIKKKTGSSDTTFKDLANNPKYKDVVFIGTNLSTHYSEIFSIRNTPDMTLSDALRITMSIPLFFRAVQMDNQVYVDGGLLMNYPVKVFDRESMIRKENIEKKHFKEYYRSQNKEMKRTKDDIDQYVYNKETLGFRLDSNRQIEIFKEERSPSVNKIDNLFDYMWHLIKTMYYTQNNLHLHSDDWHRTVYINTLGVGTTDFDIEDDMKNKLIESGYDNTVKYFGWFDNPRKRVKNR